MRALDEVIKAYDVRGVYPDQLDEELAHLIGRACVEVLGLRAADGGTGSMIVGRDMRPSGPALVEAFARGVTEAGVDVIDIGLCSTDGLYFASGRLGHAGAMFTASHNPAQYNGIKLCAPGAVPVGRDTGLAQISDFCAAALAEGASAAPADTEPVAPGSISAVNLLGDYAVFLRSLVPGLDTIRELSVVVDAGNGMAGLTAPAVLGPLPLKVTEMYYELDGTFPNHEANPIDPANLVDLQAKVLEVGADLGLAFDGDADRCFAVDQAGELISPSSLTALIAVQELQRHPGATVIHNLITSAAVPEIIVENGGVPVRTRVGHSFIKATMAETGAVFGGEHSGHFYFQDFWRADSGMLAALHLIAALGNAPIGTTVADLLAPYNRYVASGEINSTVADGPAATAAVREAFAPETTSIDELDGLTMTGESWWFNVRPSNTEPLLRLNVEHRDEESMAELRDRVLAVIRSHSA
ncbi:MAG: phosphomannomutase/phosphoglucomutase [Actinobacteria bacterium]|nr:phosphomannomutase/phosphoglucomutase [Actinomycetota bacterium]